MLCDCKDIDKELAVILHEVDVVRVYVSLFLFAIASFCFVYQLRQVYGCEVLLILLYYRIIFLDVRSLSEILGHADVATTLRKYAHTTMERKAEAMQAMSILF